MGANPTTKELLHLAESICVDEDRSREYTIQYMQDFANVSFDCVMNYIKNISTEEMWEGMIINK